MVFITNPSARLSFHPSFSFPFSIYPPSFITALHFSSCFPICNIALPFHSYSPLFLLALSPFLLALQFILALFSSLPSLSYHCSLFLFSSLFSLSHFILALSLSSFYPCCLLFSFTTSSFFHPCSPLFYPCSFLSPLSSPFPFKVSLSFSCLHFLSHSRYCIFSVHPCFSFLTISFFFYFHLCTFFLFLSSISPRPPLNFLLSLCPRNLKIIFCSVFIISFPFICYYLFSLISVLRTAYA